MTLIVSGSENSIKSSRWLTTKFAGIWFKIVYVVIHGSHVIYHEKFSVHNPNNDQRTMLRGIQIQIYLFPLLFYGCFVCLIGLFIKNLIVLGAPTLSIVLYGIWFLFAVYVPRFRIIYNLCNSNSCMV